MKTLPTRRSFLTTAALTSAALAAPGPAAEKVKMPEVKSPLFSKPSKMHLGTVTYNLAEKWDIATIIQNCTEAKFEGVELRTGHAHKVEVNLTQPERADVRKRFADSAVKLWSLGSAFDYHTPDQARLRKDIEATKEYILLAEDVGATGVKVRPNALPKEVPVEQTLAQIGKSLRELGEFGAQHGQQIRLEVHGTGTNLVPHIKTILDAADHKNVGLCWNSNQSDLFGDGWDANFNLVKHKIFTVHMRDLYLDEYPFRKLLTGLNEIGFSGFTFAEIPPSTDPIRTMKYFRALWLAYQGLL